MANGWLGAGAITLGVGAALASGSGLAYADDTGTDGSAGAASPSSSADSGVAEKATEKPSDLSAGPSISTLEPASSTATPSATPLSTTVRPRSITRVSSSSILRDGITLGSSSTGKRLRPTAVADAAEKPVTVSAAAEADVAESAAPGSAALEVQRDVQQVAATTSKSGSAAASTAVVTPRAAEVTTRAVTPPAVAVLPAAATPMAPPLQANPVTGALTEVVAALNTLILPNPTVPPANPLHLLVIEVVRHFEMAFGLPVIGTPVVYRPDPVIGTNPVSTGPGTPSADDVVHTPYGTVGAWLLEPSGQISDFGGQQVDGKTLLEPINLIIVDPTSTPRRPPLRKPSRSSTPI